jgi:hypothetical protein
MAQIDDDEIDQRDFPRHGDDSPPLFASVRDTPYCRGCLTSEARTASLEYQRFLNRHKEDRNGRK